MESRRPRTRAECVDGPRPCPWIGCRFHLLADVSGAGTLFVRDVGALPTSRRAEGGYVEEAAASVAGTDGDTCALDVSDRGAVVLEEVGGLIGVTRERARQIESGALLRLRRRRRAREVAED